MYSIMPFPKKHVSYTWFDMDIYSSVRNFIFCSGFPCISFLKLFEKNRTYTKAILCKYCIVSCVVTNEEKVYVNMQCHFNVGFMITVFTTCKP